MQILSTGQGLIFTWNGNETSYMFSLGLCFFSFVLSCFPFSLFLSSLRSLFLLLFLPIPPSFFLSFSLLLSLLPSLLLLRFPSPAVLSQGGNRGISKICRHAGSFLELWHRQAWSLCEVSSVTIHLWDRAVGWLRVGSIVFCGSPLETTPLYWPSFRVWVHSKQNVISSREQVISCKWVIKRPETL